MERILINLNKVIRVIFIILAFLFLGLGVIGVVLPILPTTPFLLLASFFFARGSDRFHRWFMKTGIYKRYIKDFIETRSMTIRNKVKTLMLSTTLLLVGFILVPHLHARIFIMVVMVVKYWYFIFRIKNKSTVVNPDESLQ